MQMNARSEELVHWDEQFFVVSTGFYCFSIDKLFYHSQASCRYLNSYFQILAFPPAFLYPQSWKQEDLIAGFGATVTAP